MLVSPCCLTAADHIWGAVWARKWAAPFNPVTQPEGEQVLGICLSIRSGMARALALLPSTG